MRIRTLLCLALLVSCGGESTTTAGKGDAEAEADAGAGADADAEPKADAAARECPKTRPVQGEMCGSALAFSECAWDVVGEAGTCKQKCTCGGQEHFSWYCDDALDCH